MVAAAGGYSHGAAGEDPVRAGTGRHEERAEAQSRAKAELREERDRAGQDAG